MAFQKLRCRKSWLALPLLVLTPQVWAAAEPISNITLNQDLLDSVNAALPEGNAENAAFLNGNYDPTVRLSEDAQVSVTFVNEGAGYRNSLGYFTFTETAFDGLTFADIDTNSSGNIDYGELTALSGVTSTGVIFENASRTGAGGSLNAGDTVVLGGGTASQDVDGNLLLSGGTNFEAGTNMGFFLVQNGFNGSGVKGIDDGSAPLMVFSTDFLNPENSASATIGNPVDAGRHTAMMFATAPGDGILSGTEDLHRTDHTQNDYNYRSDEDFNDLVFIVNANPYTALDGTNVPTTEQVINPAPAGVMGTGSGALGLMAWGFLIWRRKQYR